MLVKDWMSDKVISINASATVQEAINTLMDHHVSMLPVLDNGKLVGVVTDRDVKHASPSDACLLDFQNIMYHVSRVEVAQIMTPEPITLTPDLTIEEAAEILLNNDISGAPLVNTNGDLIGVITKDDIFAALIALSGHKGTLFGFELEDRPGSIKEVTDILRRYGGRLVSIVSAYETSREGYRNVYIRAFDLLSDKMEELKTDLKNTAHMLYFIDYQENIREFFA